MNALETAIGGVKQMDTQKKLNEQYIVRRLTSTKQSGIDIVLGGQWGDEGKGKLVDILSQVCDIVVVCVCVLRWKHSYIYFRMSRVNELIIPHHALEQILQFRITTFVLVLQEDPMPVIPLL